MVQCTAILTLADQYEVECDVAISAIFNDLE